MKKNFKNVQNGWSGVISREVCIGPKHPDGRVSTSGNVGPSGVRKLTYESGLDHDRDSSSVSVREPSCATLKQQHSATSVCMYVFKCSPTTKKCGQENGRGCCCRPKTIEGCRAEGI